MQQNLSPTPRKRRPGGGRKQVAAPSLPVLASGDEETLAQKVYDALRAGLMAGSIEPGMPLTVRSLSQVMGVSATPVREALKLLEADGVLEARNKSAFYARELGGDEMRQVLDMRLALEGLAVRRAALAAGPEDLDRITRLNDHYAAALRAAGDNGPLILQRNHQFHFAIYALCGSPLLLRTIETMWLRIGPTLHFYIDAGGMDGDSPRYHEDMIDALRERDADAAEAALRDDLIAAARKILRLQASETTGNRQPYILENVDL